MNELLKLNEVFKLKDLVSYKDGELNKVLVARTNGARFVLMAYDEGVELKEHAACGNAVLFALEGNATIHFNGNEYQISEGENFFFPQGELHSIKANTKFKMALVVII